MLRLVQLISFQFHSNPTSSRHAKDWRKWTPNSPWLFSTLPALCKQWTLFGTFVLLVHWKCWSHNKVGVGRLYFQLSRKSLKQLTRKLAPLHVSTVYTGRLIRPHSWERENTQFTELIVSICLLDYEVKNEPTSPPCVCSIMRTVIASDSQKTIVNESTVNVYVVCLTKPALVACESGQWIGGSYATFTWLSSLTRPNGNRTTCVSFRDN